MTRPCTRARWSAGQGSPPPAHSTGSRSCTPQFTSTVYSTPGGIQLTVQAHVPAHHSTPVQYTVHQGVYSPQCTPQYISEELLVFNVLVIRAGCGANFPRQRITGWAVPPPYSYGKCTDTTVTPLLCIVGWRRGNICADHISGNSDKPPLLARWRKNYWRDAQLRFIEP